MPPKSVLLKPNGASHLSLPYNLLKPSTMSLLRRLLSSLKEIIVLNKLLVPLPQFKKLLILIRYPGILPLGLVLQSCILHF